MLATNQPQSNQASSTASDLYQRLQTIANSDGFVPTPSFPQQSLPENPGQEAIYQRPVAPEQPSTPDQTDRPQQQQSQQQQQDQQQPSEQQSPGQQPSLPYNRATAPQESAIMPGMYKPLPEELLLEWIAPSRPFRKPNRRFFTTITMIAVLIGLILFFANQILPVAVVIAVVFLAYVLFSIPPSDVRYRLTTYGIRIEDQLYYWEELGRFWFTQQYEIDILHIEVARFPNTIHLLLGDIERSIMQEILSEVLLFERPPLTPVEKAGKWLQEKVPLDLES